MTKDASVASEPPADYVLTWALPGGTGFAVRTTADFGISILSYPDMGPVVVVSPDQIETLASFLTEALRTVDVPSRLEPKDVDHVLTWSVRDFGGVDVSIRTDGMVELTPWNTSKHLHPTIAPESVDTLVVLLRHAAQRASSQVHPVGAE